MHRKAPKWLEDIRASCSFILRAVEGRGPREYREDALIRAAVERHFEIIGEAMRRLADFDPETAARIGNYPRVISFRNVLIHGYDLVDHDVVYKVIQENVPVLKREVEEILRETGAELEDGS